MYVDDLPVHSFTSTVLSDVLLREAVVQDDYIYMMHMLLPLLLFEYSSLNNCKELEDCTREAVAQSVIAIVICPCSKMYITHESMPSYLEQINLRDLKDIFL